MSTNLKNIPTKLLEILAGIKRYTVVIFIVSVLSLYGYLILYVNDLAQTEADEDAVYELLEASKRPQVDKQAVDKILQLQDQNVQVETLFKDARNNPFSE